MGSPMNQNGNDNGNDYVSLVRIPRKWFNVFVWTFSSLVIANVLIEFCTGWAWEHLGETVLTRTAVLMTLIVGWFFILAHIWEAIMLGYAKLFKDKILAQGRAEGKAEGRAEVYRELQEAHTPTSTHPYTYMITQIAIHTSTHTYT